MSREIPLHERLEGHLSNLKEVVRGATPWIDASDARMIVEDIDQAILALKANAKFPQKRPSEAFAEWLSTGPKLALAAGCNVGIKVTAEPPTGGRMDE